MAVRAEYDRVISETEAAYARVLESCQSLLVSVKQQVSALPLHRDP